MNDLKKSYWDFVLIVVLFICAIIGICFIPLKSEIAVVISMALMYVWITFLIVYMYFMDRAYWITGTSFEDCAKVSKDERKKFIMRILDRFLIADLVYAVYAIFAVIFTLPTYGTVIVASVVIVCFALSVIPIKLTNGEK